MSSGVITKGEMNWVTDHQNSFNRTEEAVAQRLGRLIDEGAFSWAAGCRCTGHHSPWLVLPKPFSASGLTNTGRRNGSAAARPLTKRSKADSVGSWSCWKGTLSTGVIQPFPAWPSFWFWISFRGTSGGARPRRLQGCSGAAEPSRRTAGWIAAEPRQPRRQFWLMPRLHSEDLEVQNAALPLFERWTDPCTLAVAMNHRDTIALLVASSGIGAEALIEAPIEVINGDAYACGGGASCASPSAGSAPGDRLRPSASQARTPAPAQRQRPANPQRSPSSSSGHSIRAANRSVFRRCRSCCSRGRATGPFVQIKAHGTMEQTDGIHIQIELERWVVVSHHPIAPRRGWGHPTVESNNKKPPLARGLSDSTEAESLNFQPQPMAEPAEPQEWTHGSQVEGGCERCARASLPYRGWRGSAHQPRCSGRGPDHQGWTG